VLDNFLPVAIKIIKYSQTLNNSYKEVRDTLKKINFDDGK
jgi:hypothetical protein